VKGLRGFIIKRIFQSVLTLTILITILFFLFRILPGDPTTMFVDAALPQEAREAVLQQFGLDKPLHEQYFLYMSNLVKGEFGVSFTTRTPVLEVIGEKFWNTVFLMGATVFLALLIGIIGGALAAWYRGTKFEIITVTIAMFFRSSPVFWVGMVALALFSYNIQIFPTGGMYTPGQQFTGFWDKYFTLDFLKHLILPTLVGAGYYVATPLLIMRSSMIEIMEDDFIEMARAKGLKERVVLYKHAMRNATLPVVTEAALLIGFAIGGQVLVETVFRWPGLGREIVYAVQMNDYPVAQATFFLMGVLVVFLNLVSDILYGYLDPRVTYE
jgi:peptide/nickel transport system permease protein